MTAYTDQRAMCFQRIMFAAVSISSVNILAYRMGFPSKVLLGPIDLSCNVLFSHSSWMG